VARKELKVDLNETAPRWERLRSRSSPRGLNKSRPTPAGARPGSTPPLNQGDPPCQSPAWPPGPRQGWAAGSDRFWLRELRASHTFLYILRSICSGHGYPAGRAANTSCPRSDRFWLLELRVSHTFLYILRSICSGHGYPAQRAANTSCPRSDRFWLLELRVSRTFLDQLRSRLFGPWACHNGTDEQVRDRKAGP